jgi:hypothetical protein
VAWTPDVPDRCSSLKTAGTATNSNLCGNERGLMLEYWDTTGNTEYVAVVKSSFYHTDETFFEVKGDPAGLKECAPKHRHVWSDETCWGLDHKKVPTSGYVSKNLNCDGSLGPAVIEGDDVSKYSSSRQAYMGSGSKLCTTPAGVYYFYVVASTKGPASVSFKVTSVDAGTICSVHNNALAFGLGFGLGGLLCCCCCGAAVRRFCFNRTKEEENNGADAQSNIPMQPMDTYPMQPQAA